MYSSPVKRGLLKKEYLNKNFDYEKLTKQELRSIMAENNVEDIPPLTALKSVIIKAYKKNIYDKIESLKENFSSENIFQKRKGNPVIEIEKSKSSRPTIELEGNANSMHDTRNVSPGYSTRNASPVIKLRRKDDSLRRRDDFSRRGDDSILNEDQILTSPFIEESDEGLNQSLIFDKSINSSLITNKSINGSLITDDLLNNNSGLGMESMSRSNIRGSNIRESDNIRGSNIRESDNIRGSNIKGKGRVMKSIRRLLILGMITASIIYLKFFIPYCTGSEKFCVIPPRHSHFENGELKCDKGYKLKHGIIDFCVKDREMERKIEEIVRNLEYIRGDVEYGGKLPENYTFENICKDQELREILKRSPKVVIKDNRIWATDKRVGMRTFFKYYMKWFVRIISPLVIFSVIVKILLFRSRRRRQLNEKGKVFFKEASKLLLNQLLMSVKHVGMFKPFLYERQICENLDIDERTWKIVKKYLTENCNVEDGMDDLGSVYWRWTGPIQSKADVDGLVL